MIPACKSASKICVFRCQIWPDFAKSWIWPGSQIWVSPFHFNVLWGALQICQWVVPNLLTNLGFLNKNRHFCQISDLSESTPKGVGGLPPQAGRSTTHPWAIFSSPSSGSRSIRRQRPDLTGHMHAVVAHPQSQPEKETMMAELTSTTRMREAIPDLPLAFRADRSLLALDLGTTTGWALHGADGLITSGTVSFRPGRFDGGGMRYLRFTNWLGELDRLSGPISTIWFEEVRRHVGTDAAHVYGGLMATLTAWAELRGVPYEGVPVGTIKRHATGKGNADKEAMIAAARARGFSPADDNEADAIAILFWALETKGGLQ